MNAREKKIGNQPISEEEAKLRIDALKSDGNFPCITFNIATVQRRKKSFLQVLKSLSEQYLPCDVINIAMSYDKTDDEINDFLFRNFKCVRHKYGKFSCEHKLFAFESMPDSFVICFDDDINYPKDYTLRLIEGIEKHNREKVVSFHGMKFPGFPVKDFLDRKLYQYYEYVGEDSPVDVIGSGVMGFYAKTLLKKGFSFEKHLTQTRNLTDDVVSKFCRDNGIGMTCLAHPLVWLKIMPDTQDSECTWVVMSKNKNADNLKFLES